MTPLPVTLSCQEKSYQVLSLLGKGKGGYSYLVTDGIHKYVLKQIHHEPCSYYQFGDKLQSELNDYARLNEVGICMPLMLDYDQQQERILKQYIDGPTVYQLVLEDRLPQEAFAQLYQMCEKLYSAGINIDYFPTNFVLEEGKLFYIDYECNEYMQQWDFAHWGCKYWEKSEEFLEYAKNAADI